MLVRLRLKLAQWIAPRGAQVCFMSQTFDGGKPGPVKILQDQFMTDQLAAELAQIVDDVNGGPITANPADLWRETRKQLVEDKGDDAVTAED